MNALACSPHSILPGKLCATGYEACFFLIVKQCRDVDRVDIQTRQGAGEGRPSGRSEISGKILNSLFIFSFFDFFF